MGALKSPDDYRNIQLATFQAPVTLPDDFESVLPPVENQGSKPKCVGSAIHKIAELYLSRKQQGYIDLSDDDLYEQCKLIDGLPDIGGTYPSIGAKIATKNGIATVEAYNTGDEKIIAASRETNKLSGYAFVARDYFSICQAIYQNQAIIATFSVDSNWFIGKLMKIVSSIGRHCVVLNGFTMSKNLLKGQNSWGVAWVGYIAGVINPAVKAGHFEVLWPDYMDNISDLISFTLIPPPILEDAQKKQFIFTKEMSIGMTDYEVRKLQERLGIPVPTGYFGSTTQKFVKNYQITHGIKPTGNVGPITLMSLNGKVKLDLWCEAIKELEGWYVGSRSYRNNNPGNLKFVGQKRAIKKDKDGFCVFANYADGYQELKDLLIRAATTPDSSTYQANMTLLQFFRVYAPSSDNNLPDIYAQKVAQKIGVGVDVPISSLI